MAVAKRQGREKPAKIEQRKVKGRSEDPSEDFRQNKQHSWVAQFAQGRPRGREKHIKRGTKGLSPCPPPHACALSLSRTLSHARSLTLLSLTRSLSRALSHAALSHALSLTRALSLSPLLPLSHALACSPSLFSSRLWSACPYASRMDSPAIF